MHPGPGKLSRADANGRNSTFWRCSSAGGGGGGGGGGRRDKKRGSLNQPRAPEQWILKEEQQQLYLLSRPIAGLVVCSSSCNNNNASIQRFMTLTKKMQHLFRCAGGMRFAGVSLAEAAQACSVQMRCCSIHHLSPAHPNRRNR